MRNHYDYEFMNLWLIECLFVIRLLSLSLFSVPSIPPIYSQHFELFLFFDFLFLDRFAFGSWCFLCFFRVPFVSVWPTAYAANMLYVVSIVVISALRAPLFVMPSFIKTDSLLLLFIFRLILMTMVIVVMKWYKKQRQTRYFLFTLILLNIYKQLLHLW